MKVSDLPLGKGKAVLQTKNGKKIRVNGEVTEKNGQKFLITIHNGVKLSFSPNTIVRKWKAI